MSKNQDPTAVETLKEHRQIWEENLKRMDRNRRRVQGFLSQGGDNTSLLAKRRILDLERYAFHAAARIFLEIYPNDEMEFL